MYLSSRGELDRWISFSNVTNRSSPVDREYSDNRCRSWERVKGELFNRGRSENIEDM